MACGRVFIVLAHPTGDDCYVVGVYANPYGANVEYEWWAARKRGWVETVPIWVVNGGDVERHIHDVTQGC